MVKARRLRCAARGYDTVLSSTFTRCRVGQSAAAAYLDSYLHQALASHAGLETEIQQALGRLRRLADHFGYYVGALARGKNVPLSASTNAWNTCSCGPSTFVWC